MIHKKNDNKENIEEQVQKKTEEVEEERDECEERVQNLESQLKRAIADYQNLQKRAQIERLDWIKTANKDLIIRLLPILDTLLLAQKHVEDEGLKLSIKLFFQTLQEEGVEQIKTEGKEFDPHTMEAVGIEEGEEGKVLEEIRAGYKIEDKVLRVAQVKVGQKS